MVTAFRAWCSGGKPPKGFEKFYKEKPGGSKGAEKPKEKQQSQQQPRQSRQQPERKQQQQQNDLSELFRRSFSGGSGGSSGGGAGGGMSDPEKQQLAKLAGLGLLALVGVAVLNQSRYREISWKEFVGSLLSKGVVEKLEVVNKKWVKVHLNTATSGEVLWF